MKFNYEEAELFNNIFQDQQPGSINKEQIINKIDGLKINTVDTELVDIATSLLSKLEALSDDTIAYMLNNLPIDIENKY
jgi:hypothetical protein